MSNARKQKIRIATRGSRLALIQAGMAAERLIGLGYETEFITIKTGGDRNRNEALAKIGGKGLFVREIEAALLRGEADIAVHSAKDLPAELSEGLVIGGVPEEGPCEDCLVTVKGGPYEGLCRTTGRIAQNAPSPVIGTASPRREMELKRLYPDASFCLIRGNVETRLQKLIDPDAGYDATILAAAGLDRLKPDLSGFEVRTLSPEECIPAACQGIIAIECRADDTKMRRILSDHLITDPMTRYRFDIERYVLEQLHADCSMPVGVHAALGEAQDNGDIELIIRAMLDGRYSVREGLLSGAYELADTVVGELLQ